MLLTKLGQGFLLASSIGLLGSKVRGQYSYDYSDDADYNNGPTDTRFTVENYEEQAGNYYDNNLYDYSDEANQGSGSDSIDLNNNSFDASTDDLPSQGDENEGDLPPGGNFFDGPPADIEDFPCNKTISLDPVSIDTSKCNCNCDLVIPEPPKNEPTPIFLTFVVETSDGMQAKDKQLTADIHYWIWSIVKKLEEQSFVDGNNNPLSPQIRENFIVLIQFAEYTFVEYANRINTKVLEETFLKTLDDMEKKGQQESSSNLATALWNVNKLMSQPNKQVIASRLEENREAAFDSGSHDMTKVSLDEDEFDEEAWDEVSQKDSTKILFIITDGNVNDKAKIPVYNQKLQTVTGNPDTTLVKEIGKQFDRIDIMIVRSQGSSGPGLAKELADLRNYGYLHFWNPTKPAEIFKSVERTTNNINQAVNRKANTDVEIEIEFVILNQLTYCNCVNYRANNEFFLDSKQFLKGIMGRIRRDIDLRDYQKYTTVAKYYSERDLTANECLNDNEYDFQQCCSLNLDVQRNNRTSVLTKETKDDIEAMSYMSKADATKKVCQGTNMNNVIENAIDLFKCQDSVNNKKCIKILLITSDGKHTKNQIFHYEPASLEQTLRTKNVQIFPIKLGNWKKSSASDEDVKKSNHNIHTLSTFEWHEVNSYPFIDREKSSMRPGMAVWTENAKLAFDILKNDYILKNIPQHDNQVIEISSDLSKNWKCSCDCDLDPINQNLNLPPMPGHCGPQGPEGEMGEMGEVGFPGLPGRDGEDGADGLIGRQGENGVRGPEGPEGETGPDGQDGNPGAPGQDGDVGEQGDSGNFYSQLELNEIVKSFCTCDKTCHPPPQDVPKNCHNFKIVYLLDATESVINYNLLEDAKDILKDSMNRFYLYWDKWAKSVKQHNQNLSENEQTDLSKIQISIEIQVIGMLATARAEGKQSKFPQNFNAAADIETMRSNTMTFIDSIDPSYYGAGLVLLTPTMTDIYNKLPKEEEWFNLLIVISDRSIGRDIGLGPNPDCTLEKHDNEECVYYEQGQVWDKLLDTSEDEKMDGYDKDEIVRQLTVNRQKNSKLWDLVRDFVITNDNFKTTEDYLKNADWWSSFLGILRDEQVNRFSNKKMPRLMTAETKDEKKFMQQVYQTWENNACSTLPLRPRRASSMQKVQIANNLNVPVMKP